MNARRIKNLKLEGEEKERRELSVISSSLYTGLRGYAKLGPYWREPTTAPKESLPKAYKDHVP